MLKYCPPLLLFLLPAQISAQPAPTDGQVSREICNADLVARPGKDDRQSARLLDRCVAFFETGGENGAAENWLVTILSNRQRVSGTEAPETLEISDRLARLYQSTGRFGDAEALYDRALAIRRRALGPEHPDALESANNLAIVFAEQGRWAEAEKEFLRILEVRERALGPDHLDTLESVNNLASIYKLQARYGDAEPLFLRALEGRAKSLGATHPITLRSTSNLANVLMAQGRYADAEPLYLKARDESQDAEGADHPDTLLYLNNLSILYKLQGRYEEAEKGYLSALEARKRILGLEHPYTLDTINDLADLYSSMDRYREAEPLYLQAVEIRQNTLGAVHPDTLRSVHTLADLYLADKRYGQAEAFYLRALMGRMRSLNEGNVWFANSYEGIGHLIADRDGDNQKASYFLKKAVNILQGVRQNMSKLESGTHRAFLDRWADTYSSLQYQLAAQGRFAEAEQVGRMIKEVEYLAFVRGESDIDSGRSMVLTAQEKAWDEQLDSWMARPNRLASELDVLRGKRKNGGILSALEQVQLADLEKAYDVTYGEFRNTLNGWLGDVRALENEKVQEEARALELASAERLQGVIADIGPDVALLQLVAFEDSLHMFLTTPKAFKHIAVPVGRSDLFKVIFAARQEIDRGRNPDVVGLPDHDAGLRTQLGKLYDWLVKPVETDLSDAGTRILMLNLQGQIRYVPFAALWDGEGWLTERFQLALFTPAAQTRFETPASMRRGAAFGLSDMTEGFSALPAVPTELALIMGRDGKPGILKGKSQLNGDFTRAAFEAGLVDPEPVLHIASHFAIRPGDEASSFLVLGDGTHLTLAEINRSSKLRFRGVEILTLSACETGLGGTGTGMEIEGMGALAQNKGAASVMATLWQVADDTTPEFMSDFYTGLAAGNLSKAAALQAAQIRMIRSPLDGDPFYWAPFIIMGNWK